jgi:ankyrin repeat protein
VRQAQRDSFEDAVAALRRGDFSASAPLFDEPTPTHLCRIIEWFDDGRFPGHEDALHEAFTCACFLGRNDVVRFFLERGVGPQGGAATGIDALHWAVNRGQLETVKVLLSRGADLETRNLHGGTALGIAVWSAFHEPRPAHLEIIETLLAAGAKPDEVPWPTGDPHIDALLTKRRAIRRP